MTVAARAGKFSIDAYELGWPIWCVLHRDGEELRKFSSDELYDLQYVVKRVIAQLEEAKQTRRQGARHG